MKKIILAPDSFKGTMSAKRVCEIMGKSIRKRYPACEIIQIPVADGGEGSVECFLGAVGGERISLRVMGPLGSEVDGYYGILQEQQGEKIAVIEMAACAGLPLVEGKENPEKTTTYGVGELIADALDRGCRRIILGLGGSATNDCGCGMAVALGARFFNEEGETFLPVGGNLSEVARIDLGEMRPELWECSITAMCDIDNPLYGPLGAACVFGPQKGADEAMVSRLDAGLSHMAEVIRRDLGVKVDDMPGAGAAGGMGAGAAAFLKAGLKPGIETVLDTVDFDGKLGGAAAVFTGEGRVDAQSLMGKVIGGIAKRTSKKRIPLVVVAGSIEDPLDGLYEAGVSAAVSINRKAQPFHESRWHSEDNLEWTMDNVLRLMEL